MNIYFFREPLAKLLFLVGLSIALFAPLDVLDRIPWFRFLSHPFMEIFPPIKYYVQKSAFPQVTELFFTTMWAVSPAHLYWFRKDMSEQFNPQMKNWNAQKFVTSPISVLRLAFVLVIILPFVILSCWSFNHGYDFSWLPMNSSRIAMGFGGFFVAGTAGWWALWFEYLLAKKVSLEIREYFSRKG